MRRFSSLSATLPRAARLIDPTTSITRGTSYVKPVDLPSPMPARKPTPAPAARPPPSAVPAAAAPEPSKGQTPGRYQGAGDPMRSAPVPYNLSDRFDGHGLRGLERHLVETLETLHASGGAPIDLKQLVLDSQKLNGVVLDRTLRNESAPEASRKVDIPPPRSADAVAVEEPTAPTQAELNVPSTEGVRVGVVTLAHVIGGGKDAVVELSSAFVIGEQNEQDLKDGRVMVVCCAHTLQSIAIKLPSDEAIPSASFIISSASSEKSAPLQIFPVKGVLSAVLASDLVLLSVSTLPLSTGAAKSTKHSIFKSLPVTAYPAPTGSPIALPGYKIATRESQSAPVRSRTPIPPPRSLDPLDDIFFRLPAESNTPRPATPTITNPNPFAPNDGTYFSSAPRQNGMVNIEAERAKILKVVNEMRVKEEAAMRAQLEQLKTGEKNQEGDKITDEPREWQFGRVIEYKDDHARVIDVGSSDGLHAVTFSVVPISGLSGSPIVALDSGAVVAVVRGSTNRYGDRQRRGFGTPADAIFGMFKLDGFESDGSKTELRKNEVGRQTVIEGVQAAKRGKKE